MAELFDETPKNFPPGHFSNQRSLPLDGKYYAADEAGKDEMLADLTRKLQERKPAPEEPTFLLSREMLEELRQGLADNGWHSEQIATELYALFDTGKEMRGVGTTEGRAWTDAVNDYLMRGL